MSFTVLIVDDHAAFRARARRTLEADGCVVLGEACDGAGALDAARRLTPDVVLLDVGLPDISGLEVAARLAARERAPAVVLTSTRAVEDVGTAAHAPARPASSRSPSCPRTPSWRSCAGSLPRLDPSADTLRQAFDVAEERTRAILHAALDCVVVMDDAGQVLDFNPAAERTFGIAAADAVGKEMAGLIVPDRLRDRHRRGLERYLAGAPATMLDRRVEIAAVRADGTEFPVELTITRTGLPGAPVFVGYLRDISDRLAAERELLASRVRIVEAADAARRRIERDLHDGAQQRLVGLALTLRLRAHARDRRARGDQAAAQRGHRRPRPGHPHDRQPAWSGHAHRRGAPVRIVIADDNLFLRTGAARLLEAAGHEIVAEAGDAEDLLRKTRAHRPEVALVDIRMPPGNADDGLRAALEIRSELPDTGVLVLSQYAEEHYVTQLLSHGAEGVGYLLRTASPTPTASPTRSSASPRAARCSTPRWSRSCSAATPASSRWPGSRRVSAMCSS